MKNNEFYCGSAGNLPCQLARLDQVPSQYVHPATKVCNYSYTHPQTCQCELSSLARGEFKKVVYSSVSNSEYSTGGLISGGFGFPSDVMSFEIPTQLFEYALWGISVSISSTITTLNYSRGPLTGVRTFASIRGVGVSSESTSASSNVGGVVSIPNCIGDISPWVKNILLSSNDNSGNTITIQSTGGNISSSSNKNATYGQFGFQINATITYYYYIK